MAIPLEPAKSGLLAGQRRMEVSAHNVANVGTDGFQHQVVTARERGTGGVDVRVDTAEVSADARQAQAEAQGEAPVEERPGGNVDVVEETVNQVAARAGFQANAKVLGTQDKTIGSLLDATG